MAIAPTDLIVSHHSELSRTQQEELKKIWLHAVRIDTDAIGWLPVAAYETRATTNGITAIHRNGDCVGWAMHGKSPSRGVMKLYQIWVRPDARIIEHGRALVAKIAETARNTQCHLVEAWVAEDLPANLFWQAIGFAKKAWRWGRITKRRKHLLWILYCEPLFPQSVVGGEKNYDSNPA